MAREGSKKEQLENEEEKQFFDMTERDKDRTFANTTKRQM